MSYFSSNQSHLGYHSLIFFTMALVVFVPAALYLSRQKKDDALTIRPKSDPLLTQNTKKAGRVGRK